MFSMCFLFDVVNGVLSCRILASRAVILNIEDALPNYLTKPWLVA